MILDKIKQNVSLLIILVLVSSCAGDQKTPQKLDASETSTNKVEFDIWNFDNCSLSSKRADVSLKMTYVYEKSDIARFIMHFDYPLEETPKIKIYSLEDYDIDLTGQGTEYVFELPVKMVDQARMFLEQAFLKVTYKIKGKDYYRNAIFNMKGVPDAILAYRKKCYEKF